MKFFEITITPATSASITFGLYFHDELSARTWVEFTYPGHSYYVCEGSVTGPS